MNQIDTTPYQEFAKEKNAIFFDAYETTGKHKLERLGKLMGIENIDAEVQSQLALKESEKKSVTFTQIAETLAGHYDLIYYIDCESSKYA